MAKAKIKIVTKESLNNMLQNPEKRVLVLGRALLAIYKRQTEQEQNINDTVEHNNVGFTSADAARGSISARYFMHRHTLNERTIAHWMAKTKNGYPRICKYSKQLNEIAIERASKKESV